MPFLDVWGKHDFVSWTQAPTLILLPCQESKYCSSQAILLPLSIPLVLEPYSQEIPLKDLIFWWSKWRRLPFCQVRLTILSISAIFISIIGISTPTLSTFGRGIMFFLPFQLRVDLLLLWGWHFVWSVRQFLIVALLSKPSKIWFRLRVLQLHCFCLKVPGSN